MPTRVRMVLDLAALGAPVRSVRELPGQHPLAPADAPALGALALQAFRNGPDDEGEALGDHVREMRRTLAGVYGPMHFQASAVVRGSDRIVAAVLINIEDGTPFMPYCLVEPSHQGRGIGTRLVLQSAHRLKLDGYARLSLAVVDGGRAAHLYRRLGFRAIDASR